MSYLEGNRVLPVKNKGNESYKELKEAILTWNISIFRNGGWHHLSGVVKLTILSTLLEEAKKCLHWYNVTRQI